MTLDVIDWTFTTEDWIDLHRQIQDYFRCWDEKALGEIETEGAGRKSCCLIEESVWVEISFQPPCHIPPAHVAQSTIQPESEHFQGWGTPWLPWATRASASPSITVRDFFLTPKPKLLSVWSHPVSTPTLAVFCVSIFTVSWSAAHT